MSENRNIAIDFANGKYHREGRGRPILFEISTLSRGAPLISWSQHPLEDEILFQPFQGFEVVGQLCYSDMLLVRLQTVRLQKTQNRSPKIQVPHHHYARSSAKSYLQTRGDSLRACLAVAMLMQPVWAYSGFSCSYFSPKPLVDRALYSLARHFVRCLADAKAQDRAYVKYARSKWTNFTSIRLVSSRHSPPVELEDEVWSTEMNTP